jgi:hypothetical protein
MTTVDEAIEVLTRHRCAVGGCETPDDVYQGTREPVRVWVVDTHPPKHITVGLYLCHGHAATMSWSI